MTTQQRLRGRLDVNIDARREKWLREQATYKAVNLSMVIKLLVDDAIERQAKERRDENSRST